jgi:predicted nucleotidyltransferase
VQFLTNTCLEVFGSVAQAVAASESDAGLLVSLDNLLDAGELL